MLFIIPVPLFFLAFPVPTVVLSVATLLGLVHVSTHRHEPVVRPWRRPLMRGRFMRRTY